MISLETAEVVDIIRRRTGISEITVDTAGRRWPAVNYDDIVGAPHIGDKVIINTLAVELGLGTGGRHFVLWNLNRDRIESRSDGHIIKLRYTPLQIKCMSVEEPDSPHHNLMKDVSDIDGLPVITAPLHSHLAPIVCCAKEANPDLRVVYIMTDSGALPLALSETVADLNRKRLLAGTITVGHAFGGDLEAVNIFSGLAAAKTVLEADIAVVGMGPGIVGTGTTLGYSGIEQAIIINAAAALNGRVVAVPRISFVDPRPRHRGLSHHTRTALGVVSLAETLVVIPRMDAEKLKRVTLELEQAGIAKKHKIVTIDADSTGRILDKRGFKVTTMGRSYEEDREFFNTGGAAGILAAKLSKGDRD